MHPDYRRIILYSAAAMAMIFFAIKGLRTGIYPERGGPPYRRSEKPFEFWSAQVMLILIGIALLAGAMLMLIWRR